MDARRSGRISAATEDKVLEIHNTAVKDDRLKIRDIANIGKISVDRVHNILHDHLEYEKTVREMAAAFIGIVIESAFLCTVWNF